MNYKIQIDNIRVPVIIRKSKNNRIRYSISRKSANLSLPLFYFGRFINTEKEKFEKWCFKQFRSKPELLNRFKVKSYKSGDKIKIYNQTFTIEIEQSERKTTSGKILQHNIIKFLVPNNIDEHARNLVLGKLLSRILSQHFLKEIQTRVHTLNNKYFQEHIESIKIKNNRSNWGSCSSKNNINLSSRLLFAPQQVIDYVIIHELAHLKEMNHSSKYWAIVSKIMPEYKIYEEWLKDNGHSLSF